MLWLSCWTVLGLRADQVGPRSQSKGKGLQELPLHTLLARCPLSSIIVGAKTALSPPSRNSHPRTNRPKRDGGPALTNLTASALASHQPPPPLRPPLCLRRPPT
ncbi:conserved hypothetical protein [Coccidioides posadasii str. Silveira]|uniref:Uncharacterized protein n=1 Tax=Coccidioides posadasii (strain RMSCC 757 / Silveira) TaxID=443226 RepID=E9DA07_COCPS|nr:conserved hypothetical protein [Coccidioides posadasii str. Silveira]